jgi:hypothetical protein
MKRYKSLYKTIASKMFRKYFIQIQKESNAKSVYLDLQITITNLITNEEIFSESHTSGINSDLSMAIKNISHINCMQDILDIIEDSTVLFYKEFYIKNQIRTKMKSSFDSEQT